MQRWETFRRNVLQNVVDRTDRANGTDEAYLVSKRGVFAVSLRKLRFGISWVSGVWN